MTNELLFKKIRELVAEEKRIGIEILECLYEIEKRKAYAPLKYDGLFSFCVRELGYTESQAYQRIQAMRAMHEVPEIKSWIKSGSLPVSSVSKARVFLRKQDQIRSLEGLPAPSHSEKLELFQSLKNLTSKAVDRKLAELQGYEIKEKLVLELDEDAARLWNRVKNLTAHRSKGRDVETFRIVAKEWLKKNDPFHENEKQDETLPASQKPAQHQESQRSAPTSTQLAPSMKRSHPQTRNRFIPTPLRKKVWMKYGGRCENCGSQYAIEIDHIIPIAKGGISSEENLRLLCRSCNQAAAVRIFGPQRGFKTTRKVQNPSHPT